MNVEKFFSILQHPEEIGANDIAQLLTDIFWTKRESSPQEVQHVADIAHEAILRLHQAEGGQFRGTSYVQAVFLLGVAKYMSGQRDENLIVWSRLFTRPRRSTETIRFLEFMSMGLPGEHDVDASATKMPGLIKPRQLVRCIIEPTYNAYTVDQAWQNLVEAAKSVWFDFHPVMVAFSKNPAPYRPTVLYN